MTPRHFTSENPNDYPYEDVPILDADLADDYNAEPDGVNDFVHYLRTDELDQ